MPKPKKPSPFDVPLTDAKRDELAEDLCREIDDAFNARASIIADGGKIDLADWYYEQGRTDPQNLPFPGAADLTSYFITENVDAYRARLLKAVFGVEPFCFVEGWGTDAKKAPYVEAFHAWQVPQSELPRELARTTHGALIEDGYILEVSEKVETRRIVETLTVALQLNDQGAPVFADGKPQLQTDQAGEFIPAQPGQPHAKVELTHTKTKRLGPQYDPISLKDFVFLPGHAKSRKQVWGYAYRFWSRVPELAEKVADGIYDKAAVAKLGDSSDREDAAVPLTVDSVAAQYGPSVEKELFQLSLKRDLDDDGREEWYLATVSRQSRTLLRLKRDTFAQKLGRSRCVPFVLFPRRNSVYGYSYSFDKLLTLADEHTSLRNMGADRGALATNAPMTVLEGALWNADTQPLGIGRTITVRSHDEIRPMVIPDVPVSIVEQKRDLHQAKERVGGLSDSAVGILSGERRTLGENKLVAGGSAVRVDESIGYFHEAISEVMQLSHAIWVDTLKDDPKGLEAPPSVVDALQSRGAELENGRFTADLLEGNFHFKPYGTDETADPQRQKQDFDGFVMAITNLAKVLPGFQAVLQNPEANKAILEQLLRSYRVRDRQPFLGALAMPAPPNAMVPPGAPAAPGATSPTPGGGGSPVDIHALLATLAGGDHGHPMGDTSGY